MIHIVLGTKAQLIKMAPVMRALNLRNVPYRYISTGQHRDTMDEILSNFQLRGPDLVLYDGPDVVKVSQMFFWSVRLLWKAITQRRRVFGGDRRGIVLVHGDTLSTLLGALMAKAAGLKVGHVEAGLRSFDLFQPFPEEITRLLTFYVSDYSFCPGDAAVHNLAKFRHEKINTTTNTLADALKFALPIIEELPNDQIPAKKFAVVTIHRYENVFDREALERVVHCVERIAKSNYLLFILHKPTKNNLEKFGLIDRLSANPNIELRPRYDYLGFMKIMKAADFVVSDGGSNQEECYYWGKPVLLLRNVSERPEGIGRNAVISQYRDAAIDEFTAHLERYRYPMLDSPLSPSEVIVDACRPFAVIPVPST